MKSKAPDSSPVTIRIPDRLLRKIEKRAAAAQMTRSSYMVSLLEGQTPDDTPTLAVLSRLIAIHSIVKKTKAVDNDHLHELARLIDRLSLVIVREFTQ